MATAFPQATQHGDDNFVLALNLEKDKVRTTFIELREVLTETEKKLMKALNDILSSYNSYRSDVKKMNERKRKIKIDTSNPCLHRYDRDLVLQQSVVTRGGGQQAFNPWYFFIDKFGGILI